MKIIYITTAINQTDYHEYTKLWTKAPNPSNQNFHNKLIRSLAINNELQVISIRPFSKRFCYLRSLKKATCEEKNITWNYLTIKRNKFSKIATVTKESKAILKTLNLENTIILTDTINPLCIRTANMLAKISNLPLIGICTDSPSNISGTNRAYTLYLLKQSSKCNGFIALTADLNDLFNPNNKPSTILEGVVESAKKDVDLMGEKNPYFFFAGALLEKYGVYNLIEAFKKINKSGVELYICGHSGNQSKILQAIKENKNIHYLGTLPVQNVLQYEMYALANINPRPFSIDLDKLSIPSKTLEYLSSGAPTISVKNSKLQKHFEDLAIWTKSGSVDDLYQAMLKVLDLTKKERKELGKAAKEKVQELYSLDSVNKKLNVFLSTFKSKVN